MKILIINGSPRNNGATAKILHIMEQELKKHNSASIEYINISQLQIKPCIGCCRCYKTGKCFINDDAETLSNQISQVDGIIIGSPTYASNISGQLKQFIDRGHFVIEQLLYNKYAISVATGENYGSRDTSNILNKLLKYSGAKLSGKLVHNLPFNSNTDCNIKLKKSAKRMANKLYKDIKLHKKYLLQSFIHKIIFNIGIKTFVKTKGEQYIGVLYKWKNNKVI